MMIIKRFSHPINTRTRISGVYYDSSMFWFSKFVSERIGNGGYLLFNSDIEHDQISILSGACNYVEDLESDLTDFIYGPSIVNIASFYDEQIDRLEFENDNL